MRVKRYKMLRRTFFKNDTLTIFLAIFIAIFFLSNFFLLIDSFIFFEFLELQTSLSVFDIVNMKLAFLFNLTLLYKSNLQFQITITIDNPLNCIHIRNETC